MRSADDRANELLNSFGINPVHDGSVQRALDELPQIKRGLLFCHTCGRTELIRGGEIRNGWPKCCGHTMSLDSPEERRK